MAAADKGMADGGIKRGKVYSVEVRHDGWCDLLNGRGPCNCEPEVGPVGGLPLPQEN
jgi:hypothetical protein